MKEQAEAAQDLPFRGTGAIPAQWNVSLPPRWAAAPAPALIG
jgi:hypothetical protein